MPSKIYSVSIILILCVSLYDSAPPSSGATRQSQTVPTQNQKPSFNLTTAQAVQRQVQQILATNATQTKPTFFFTNVGPNSFEYRGMFSPGKAPNLDFHKSFANFFDNFPKFPNLQFHTHTVINHRNDAPKPSPPTPSPRTVPVTYSSPRTVPIAAPVIPTVPPVRAQPRNKPRRVQKIRPFTRIKPVPPPVTYRQDQGNVGSPPNAINVQYFQQPTPPPPPSFVYQNQPVQRPQPPVRIQPIQPILYQNQIPTPAPPLINPPNSLTHILEQQHPFDLYRLTIPGSNNQPLLGNPGLGLNNINNGFANPFIDPIPRIDSPNTIQQNNPAAGPERGHNPFEFPFNFPEYHIVRGQDRAESYPKIFRFEDGRTNIVEFERNKKQFRKRKGDRVSVTSDTDPLSPDRVGRDKFLILHGGFFRQNNNDIAKVSERYTERFTSFYYDSNELQDNAESSRTTVTEAPGTPKPTSSTAKSKGYGYRI